jgi:hypothetical protein
MRRIKHSPNPVNLSTSQLVSYRRPDGLILSTGNLYFTYHDAATASVWRAAQTAVPGQEILLYSEPGVRFGDIVFANVGGVFWGYFFSDDGGGNVSIKRVPLTGGALRLRPERARAKITSSRPNVATISERKCAPLARCLVEMLMAALENITLATTAPPTQPATWAGR